MTPKELAASIAAAIIIVGVGAGAIVSKDSPPQFVKTPITVQQLTLQKTYDARFKRLSGAFVGVRGGVKTYYIYAQVDGGVQKVVISGPTHARRNPKISTNCYMRDVDGGVRDQGDMNRFPIGLAVGDCQSVAEGVYLGQDSQTDQDVSRKR